MSDFLQTVRRGVSFGRVLLHIADNLMTYALSAYGTF